MKIRSLLLLVIFVFTVIISQHTFAKTFTKSEKRKINSIHQQVRREIKKQTIFFDCRSNTFQLQDPFPNEKRVKSVMRLLKKANQPLLISYREAMQGFDGNDLCPLHESFSTTDLAEPGSLENPDLITEDPVSHRPLNTFSIAIKGEEACLFAVSDALQLLQEKSEQYFSFVLDQIKIIECVDQGSGVYSWEVPVRVLLSKRMISIVTHDLSGVLVHESCHAAEYKRYLKDPIPENSYDGERAEKECLNTQIDALKVLGAEDWMLDFYSKALETKYWEVPYEKRDW